MPEAEELLCDFCGNRIKENDEYCVKCGRLFVDDALCSNHEDIEAQGVCVICSFAFCEACGSYKNGVFLCNEHSGYEITDSFVKIYGSGDINKIRYFENILKNEGLHPFIIDKKNNRISLAGEEYPFFKVNGTENSALNEVKLLIPFNETIEAENIIKNLKNPDYGKGE